MNEGVNLAEDLKRLSSSANKTNLISTSNKTALNTQQSTPSLLNSAAVPISISNSNLIANDAKFSNAVTKFMKTEVVNELQLKKEAAISESTNPFDHHGATNDLSPDSIKAINNEKQILIAQRF